MENHPASLESKEKILNLIACYEQLTHVPDLERLTYNTAEGCHCAFKPNSSIEQISDSFDAALSAIQYNRSDFFRAAALASYESINARMRDCLIAPQLRVASQVLFVAPMPYGGPEDYGLRGGTVKSVDPNQMTCSIRGAFFTMDDVPIHYILGEYDESVKEPHYGYPSVRVYLEEQPYMADYFLGEVMKPALKQQKTLDEICLAAEKQAETLNSVNVASRSERAPERE